MYGKAIEHLVKGESAEYSKASDEANKLSIPVTAPCKENGKYAIASAEMQAWFSDFFSQEDALEIMDKNVQEHYGKVSWEVLKMSIQFNLGSYYRAGANYGRFWKDLMGEPTWSVNMSAPEMAPIEV